MFKRVKEKFLVGGGESLKSWMHAVAYVQNEKLNNGGESTIDALEGRRYFPGEVHWKLKFVDQVKI